MDASGYSDEKIIAHTNSSFHQMSGLDNLPSQTDDYNCGVMSLFYIAVKAFDLEEKDIVGFNALEFRYRLVIYLVGLKYFQQAQVSARFQDLFNSSELDIDEEFNPPHDCEGNTVL